MDTIEVNTQSTDNRPPNWTPTEDQMKEALAFLAKMQERVPAVQPVLPAVQPTILPTIQVAMQPAMQPAIRPAATSLSPRVWRTGNALMGLGIVGILWLPLSIPTMILGCKIRADKRVKCLRNYVIFCAILTFILSLGTGIILYAGMAKTVMTYIPSSGYGVIYRNGRRIIVHLCGDPYLSRYIVDSHCHLYNFVINGLGAIFIVYSLLVALPTAIVAVKSPKGRAPVVVESADAANVV